MSRHIAVRGVVSRTEPLPGGAVASAERTRLALARKKAQGALLGNRTNFADAQGMGQAANRRAADAFAANVLPIVGRYRPLASPAWPTSRALNDRGIRTARGGAWHNSTVRNLLART